MLSGFFSDLYGKRNGFFHADVSNRNKGDHIGGTHPRVLALVGIHIDDLDGAAHRFDDSSFEVIRFSDHRNDHPVVIFVCLIVKKLNPLLSSKRRHYLFDVLRIAAFAEIGHTFNDFVHTSHVLLLNFVFFTAEILSCQLLLNNFHRRDAEFAEIIYFDLPLRGPAISGMTDRILLNQWAASGKSKTLSRFAANSIA